MRVHIPGGIAIGGPGEIDPITKILRGSKTIAVVGLSSNPMRPSFGVTEYIQGEGYRIIPVNPNEAEVLGEKSYARLEDVPPVVESAIRIGAKAVWMQQGIENEAAAEKARTARLVVIEDACILVEHRRRVGELKR
jgi:predicted CoA-binding protein